MPHGDAGVAIDVRAADVRTADAHLADTSTADVDTADVDTADATDAGTRELVASAPDKRFQRQAQALAVRGGGRVVAWGTLHLDGTDQPYPFATLKLAGDGPGRGAYFVGQAPDKRWLVTFQWTGITQPFHGRYDEETLPWLSLADTRIEHGEFLHAFDSKNGRRAGWNSVSSSFGLRDGTLVVLDVDSQEDRGAGTQQKSWHCTIKCPAMATYAFPDDNYADLHVQGPAPDPSTFVIPRPN